MKGIILAGGEGTRLRPTTLVTNKHLLPVYNKPMIFYPITTLVSAGITEIMIVTGVNHKEDFLEVLKDGSEFGAKFTYGLQEKPGGIAQALGLCKEFAGNEKILVILGDNVVEDNIKSVVENFQHQEKGAKIFLSEVDNPKSYGVAEIEGEKIVNIEEKPESPKTNLAVIGLYMYDAQVWDIITDLKPSGRGELEITDVNNNYIQKGEMTYEKLTGFWGDAGESFDSMLDTANYLAKK
ncbi:NTP transferase domain-containing protein [Patescibacteria group bacterium]|nr:NTP transferase domain-containing protein [Patescibacteria group bacterium]